MGVTQNNRIEKFTLTPPILWRNTATGENVVWYMNGVSGTGAANLTTVTDQNWTIVGVE